MPRNLTRYQQAGHLHFVTFSCYRRQPFLGTPATRELFEQSLEKVRLRYDFFVTAYVVMPEHVHLLVSEPKTLSPGESPASPEALSRGTERGAEASSPATDFNVFTQDR